MLQEKVITMEHISASYGRRDVLFDVSLELRRRECLLLIGPNGSGKSTLLKVMVGLLRQKQGNVWMDGEEISALAVEERVKRGISYLPQNRNIFPLLTVEENFLMSCMDLKKSEFKNRLEWILELFPVLKKRLSQRGGLLSGGERQALATGMALIKRARIVVLDEPTAGLSPVAARTILEGIKRAKETAESSMIIVEHNLKYIAALVDRAVGLRGGQVVLETDRPAEVFRQRNRLEYIFFGK